MPSDDLTKIWKNDFPHYRACRVQYAIARRAHARGARPGPGKGTWAVPTFRRSDLSAVLDKLNTLCSRTRQGRQNLRYRLGPSWADDDSDALDELTVAHLRAGWCDPCPITARPRRRRLFVGARTPGSVFNTAWPSAASGDAMISHAWATDRCQRPGIQRSEKTRLGSVDDRLSADQADQALPERMSRTRRRVLALPAPSYHCLAH